MAPDFDPMASLASSGISFFNFFSAVSRRCWYRGSAGILISTHCPPPVMIESTAVLDAVTHILCCSCGMCFSAAPSSENDQGSMNLASNTAPVASTMPSSVAAIQLHRVVNLPLHLGDDVAGVALIPMPVERLGHRAELDNKVARQILRLYFAALLPPETNQGHLIFPHDDSGVRAAR